MDLDPNVQVAFVTVIATTISTLGVIVVAIINNRKERAQAASAGVEAGLDEQDVLKRMLELLAENGRKEATITSLKAQIRSLKAEIRDLRNGEAS